MAGTVWQGGSSGNKTWTFDRWIVWLPTLAVVLAAPLIIFPNRYTPAAFLVLPLALAPRVARRLRHPSPLDLSVLLLLGFALLGGALALDPALGQAKLAGVALGAAVFQVIRGLEPRRQNVRLIAYMLLACGIAIALVGALGTSWATYKQGAPQFLYGLLPNLAGSLPSAIANGFHPNEVGGTLTLFVPLALALSLHTTNRPLRLVACLAFLVCGAVLILTQSRGALFGVLLSCMLVLGIANRWLAYGGMAAVLASFGWLVSLGPEKLKSLLVALDQSSAYVGTVTFASRMEIWQRALYVVRDFPFTGIGLGSFPILSQARYPYLLVEMDPSLAHAHNFFLETAVDFGLGGLMALLLLLGTLGLMLGRTWSASTSGTPRALALGLGGGFVAYLVFGLADAVNWGAKPGVFFWAYLGAAGLVWQAAGRPQLIYPPGKRLLLNVPVPAALAVALVIAAIAFRGQIASSFLNNLTARELAQLAFAADGGPTLDARPTPASPTSRLQSPESYRGVIARLEGAALYDPGNPAALRNLASAHAALGDHAAAASALARAASLEPENLLMRHELAQAYSATGDTGRSLPLYGSLIHLFPENQMLRSAELDDKVLHRLNAGSDQMAAGNPLRGADEFAAVLDLRPGDLFGAAYLAQALAAGGRSEDAASTRSQLRRFTLGTDARVYRRYLPDMLPFLAIEQGFLQSGDLGRIAGFLLWRGAVEPATSLVDLLARERSEDKTTWLLEAELHLRQGNEGAAIDDLARASTLDPRDAEILYRRGRLLAASRPEDALDAYRQSLALDPNNLPVLRAGAALLTRLGRIGEADVLQSRLVALMNDRAAVAGKLGVRQEDLRLIPIQLPAIGSKARRHQEAWSWAEWVGGSAFGGAFYTGGLDELEGQDGAQTARISGLWAERLPDSGTFWLDKNRKRELARAGYWGPTVALDPGSFYALSFSYKTASWQTGDVRVMLLVPEEDSGPDDALRDTGGSWRRATFLVANRRPTSVDVRPLFTSWGVGDAWLADVTLAKVEPHAGTPMRTAGLPEIR